MPTCLVAGVREAVARVRGPVIYIANLLTEGGGMRTFTAGTGAQLIARQIGRPVDVIVVNQGLPDTETLARYAVEDKHPMPIGEIVGCSDIVTAPLWTSVYARHHRRRLAVHAAGASWRRSCWSMVGGPRRAMPASARTGVGQDGRDTGAG